MYFICIQLHHLSFFLSLTFGLYLRNICLVEYSVGMAVLVIKSQLSSQLFNRLNFVLVVVGDGTLHWYANWVHSSTTSWLFIFCFNFCLFRCWINRQNRSPQPNRDKLCGSMYSNWLRLLVIRHLHYAVEMCYGFWKFFG